MRAGTELFAERGFDGATVQEITARAGVNKAAINYHFGGKQRLYTAILRDTFAEANTQLAGLARLDLAPDAALREFVALFARVVSEHPRLPAMLIREVISGGRHLADDLLPLILGVFEHVRRIVDRGVRDGTFRPVNPLLTHLTLVGSMVFFFSSEPLRRRLIDTGRLPPGVPTGDGFVRHLQELMSRGLAAKEPS